MLDEFFLFPQLSELWLVCFVSFADGYCSILELSNIPFLSSKSAKLLGLSKQ
eukprot:c15978_g1_i1 orf=3-155(-)